MYTNHRMDQDSHWQQFDTQPILISAPWLANRPCNAPTRPHRVGKKPSVKADLAIHSHTFEVSGRSSLILFIKLYFSSCSNWDSFHKSSHIIYKPSKLHYYPNNYTLMSAHAHKHSLTIPGDTFKVLDCCA